MKQFLKIINFMILNKKEFIFLILLSIVLSGVNNYYFYDHVDRSAKRDAMQLKDVLDGELIFSRNNGISGKKYRLNMNTIVENFSYNAHYNASMILLHETKGLIWEKPIPKYKRDNVVASHIKIVIPRLKSENDINYNQRVDFDIPLVVVSILRSMTYSIFPNPISWWNNLDTNWNKTFWYRSRPAFFFFLIAYILSLFFKYRERKIAKIEQELEQERKNKEILETTFGVTEQNDDIELFEAVMSNDINKLQKIKSIHPTMNILKFNALLEHTEEEKLERLEILIDKGVDLNFEDEEGMTALMYYALGNKDNDDNSKIIELLIHKGLDIDAQNNSGMTALMLCAIKNRPTSVQILIDNGADINIKQDLTAKELAATPEIRDIIGKVENHYPKKLISLLSNFGVDPRPMKDSVHDWDFDFYERYGSFNNFLSKLEIQWNEIEEELHELSPNLHSKIQNFLFEDKNSIKNWYSQYGDKLAIGWSSLNGLKDVKDLNEWCDEGNDPFKYELSKSYKTNRGDIKLFGDVIKLFKQEVQMRREGDILDTYFLDKEETLEQDCEFEIETINLKAKQFYTDTEKFARVLDIIFKQFQDNKDFKNITVEMVEDTDGQYYDLRITQHKSFSGKSATQLLKKINSGDFSSIKENLKNLCDWSVESYHNEISFRVNFLKSSNKTDIEKLEQKALGFTHIMRFYL